MHLREDKLREMTKIVTNIEDSELVESCGWYRKRHGVTPVPLSVFVTFLCGFHHTYSKAAEALTKRCKQLGLIEIKDKVVTQKIERKYETCTREKTKPTPKNTQ